MEGKQAARGVAIELLAALQEAIGDLNDVRRIVKLVVFVNSAPHFAEPHVVANGASELLVEDVSSPANITYRVNALMTAI